jgi:hypothetical protein
MHATRRLILIIFVLLLILLFFTVPGVSFAQAPPSGWQDPARELAKKIAAVADPRQPLALSVRNLSSLSDSEVSAVRRVLDAELAAVGLRLLEKPNGAPELRITLSENVQGLLWVAEVPRDASREVAMVSVPASSFTAPLAAPQMFVLQSKLIWEQDDPILDFALTDASGGATPSLFVLEPARLVMYRLLGGSWQLQESAPVGGSGPWSRDARGRLILHRTSLQLLVPGVACTGGAPRSLDLTCNSEDEWTLQWIGEVSSEGLLVRARNFFTDLSADRANENHQRIPDFFNLAGFKNKDEHLWLLTPLDGRTLLYSGLQSEKPALLASFTGWGSDIAAIETVCGSHWQVLATRPGDWTELDALQAFEIVGREALAVSAPRHFSGPITALWTPTEGNSAHAVVRNLKAGRYEAHTLTLSCGR